MSVTPSLALLVEYKASQGDFPFLFECISGQGDSTAAHLPGVSDNTADGIRLNAVMNHIKFRLNNTMEVDSFLECRFWEVSFF